MKDKIRKCVGCQLKYPREQMIRILKKHESQEIILNPSNKDFGRSIYICNNKSCIDKAIKKGALGRIVDKKNIENIKEKLQKYLIN